MELMARQYHRDWDNAQGHVGDSSFCLSRKASSRLEWAVTFNESHQQILCHLISLLMCCWFVISVVQNSKFCYARFISTSSKQMPPSVWYANFIYSVCLMCKDPSPSEAQEPLFLYREGTIQKALILVLNRVHSVVTCVSYRTAA